MSQETLHQQMSAEDLEKFERGKTMLRDIHAGKIFDTHWVPVGEGLLAVRRTVMKHLQVDDPNDGNYKTAFGDMCAGTPYADMPKVERSNLLFCMERLPAIFEMRAEWQLKDRIRINHPSSMANKLKEWLRQKKGEEAKPKKNSSQLAVITEKYAKLKQDYAHIAEQLAAAEVSDGYANYNLMKDGPKEIAKTIVGNLAASRHEGPRPRSSPRRCCRTRAAAAVEVIIKAERGRGGGAMRIQDQSIAQLTLALELLEPGPLNADERSQIIDELYKRRSSREEAEVERKRREVEALREEKLKLAAAKKRCRTMTDDDLTSRLDHPADVIEQALIKAEINRRRQKGKERRVKEALTSFEDASEAELLAWMPSADEAETKAVAKVLRVRIKALEVRRRETKDKLGVVVRGGQMRTVEENPPLLTNGSADERTKA